MAEKVLKTLEEHLECSICLGTYTNPKLLQCLHVYCQNCLDLLVVPGNENQLSLACPNCRQVTPVPAGGVADLKAAFHINQLADIKDTVKTTVTSKDALPPEPVRESYCPCHAKRELELYCETCDELICLKCALKGGKHFSHDYEELEKASEKFKTKALSSLVPMEKSLAAVESALLEMSLLSDAVPIQQSFLESTISKHVDKLHAALDERKKALMKQLHLVIKDKLSVVRAQEVELQAVQVKLKDPLVFVKTSCQANDPIDLLKMKALVEIQVNELDTPLPDAATNLQKTISVVFSPSTTACQIIGSVEAPSLPDPSKSYITAGSFKESVVGEKATAVLCLMTSQFQPCQAHIPVTLMECVLVSELAGLEEKGSIEHEQGNRYTINYYAFVKGRHQLHIKIFGRHIAESPFQVVARLPIKEISTPIFSISDVQNPTGVAILPEKGIVVAESTGDCVSVFSPRGKKRYSFGSRGSGPREFMQPHGIAVSCKGEIFVVDSHNHRVQKFTAKGKFLKAIGTYGQGPLQFIYPNGIAYNLQNGLLYVSDGNNYVQILTSCLQYRHRFGGEGKRGFGKFGSLLGIACDSTGNVFIADSDNAIIQVFTSKGSFLFQFETTKHSPFPLGVAVTSSIVYVSDAGNDCISVYSTKGDHVHHVSSFGMSEKKPVCLKMPTGMAVDDSGVLYVCDSDNNRILVF